MDDGVGEIRELVYSDENDNYVASKKQRVEEKEPEKIEEQVTNGTGGVMSNLISAFGLSKEGKGAEVEESKIQVVEVEEKEEKEGILSGLISNLVSPRAKPEEKEDVEEGKMAVEEEKNTGGIFNNLISGILHPNGTESGGNEKVDQGEDGGGLNLIDNLVSQLPSAPIISDDSTPTSDEASMLIHSIVHD